MVYSIGLNKIFKKDHEQPAPTRNAIDESEKEKELVVKIKPKRALASTNIFAGSSTIKVT